METCRLRMNLVALIDVLMILSIQPLQPNYDYPSNIVLWLTIVGSNIMQAVVHFLQFNTKMTFFEHRVCTRPY